MPAPAVSVIIPTHNRAGLLRLALDSLARQTRRDFETIVVDDASSEDIPDACARHPVAPRIVRQDRAGPAAARNLGVSLARAPWVAFLDSDDEWLPQKLERFAAARAECPDLAIWYGPMRPIDAAGRPVAGRTKPCHAGCITRALFESSFVHVPTVECERRLFLEFGGFNAALPVCEDYDLWLRISTRHEFGLVSEPLALRRLHAERLSKSNMRRNLVVKAAVLESIQQESASQGLLEPQAARRRICRVLMAAARAAVRDRCGQQAAALLERAVQQGATPSQTLGVRVAASALRWFGLDRGGVNGIELPAHATLSAPRTAAVASRARN